jgi:hypothetical protein
MSELRERTGVYAGFATGKYGNLVGKALTDQRRIAYKVVV